MNACIHTTDKYSKVGTGSCTWIICKNINQENFVHETFEEKCKQHKFLVASLSKPVCQSQQFHHHLAILSGAELNLF